MDSIWYANKPKSNLSRNVSRCVALKFQGNIDFSSLNSVPKVSYRAEKRPNMGDLKEILTKTE